MREPHLRLVEALREGIQNSRDHEPPLKSDGGGGTSGGMTDDWKTGVEGQLSQLHIDVRMLLGGIIGSFVLLAAGGWTAYAKLSDQSTASLVEQAKTTAKLEAVDKRLESIERKIDQLVAAQAPGN